MDNEVLLEGESGVVALPLDLEHIVFHLPDYLVPLGITKVVLFEGKEGGTTVAVGHGGLDRGHKGGPLDNHEDNIHHSCAVFGLSWMVVGCLLDLLIVEGQVLCGVRQQRWSVAKWSVADG